ncbi:lachesin-like [Tachypleus tridentatus]|uniref:lachesin-like n=1 Tax=Tachypleus tridentatus TaxID=6853 RepID=UPI003FD5465A
MLDDKFTLPPRIVEGNTSTDLEVRESEEVTLRCVSTGSPEPIITWRREDGQQISTGTKKVSSVIGPSLNIVNVNRHHIGAYLCIASNGVQPSVSKRIVLGVNFPPLIEVPNQVVGAATRTDVTLDCNLESHPKSVTYWTRKRNVIVISNSKYNITEVPQGLYKSQMKLRIRNLQPEDYGTYSCSAKNSLGEAENNIKLYEIPAPVPSPQTSSTPKALKPKPEKLWNGHSHNNVAKPNENGVTTDVIEKVSLSYVIQFTSSTTIVSDKSPLPGSSSSFSSPQGLSVFLVIVTWLRH